MLVLILKQCLLSSRHCEAERAAVVPLLPEPPPETSPPGPGYAFVSRVYILLDLLVLSEPGRLPELLF